MRLKVPSVLANDFLNTPRYTRAGLCCRVRVVAWTVAEPQGSRGSRDASVACGHGLLWGHVGGGERHPEQSPAALVQKFTGQKGRWGSRGRPAAPFSTREKGEGCRVAVWLPVRGQGRARPVYSRSSHFLL